MFAPTESVLPPASTASTVSTDLSRPLTGPELLTLQLHARGYRAPQCCDVAGHGEDACAVLLASVEAALGATGLADTVARAVRRGLIV